MSTLRFGRLDFERLTRAKMVEELPLAVKSVVVGIPQDTDEPEGYRWVHYIACSAAARYVVIGAVDGSEKNLVKA